MSRLRRLFLMDEHTCPWWLGYSFDNPLRRIIHNPARILDTLVEEGQTVVDIGCGLGFFTLALAKMVGGHGKVVALDIQPEMLDRARARAKRHGLDGLVDFRLCGPDSLGLREPVDFVLAFWMVHEVSGQERFFAEVRSALRPAGRLLVAEPKVHVSAARFERIVEVAKASELVVVARPRVRLSRAVLCSLEHDELARSEILGTSHA